ARRCRRGPATPATESAARRRPAPEARRRRPGRAYLVGAGCLRRRCRPRRSSWTVSPPPQWPARARSRTVARPPPRRRRRSPAPPAAGSPPPRPRPALAAPVDPTPAPPVTAPAPAGPPASPPGSRSAARPGTYATHAPSAYALLLSRPDLRPTRAFEPHSLAA